MTFYLALHLALCVCAVANIAATSITTSQFRFTLELFYGTFCTQNMLLPSHLAFRLNSLRKGHIHIHTQPVPSAHIRTNKRGENLWLLKWYGAQTHPKRLSVDSISTMCTNNLQTEKLDEEKWKCVAASGIHRIQNDWAQLGRQAKVSHKLYSADLCGGTN